MLNFYLKMIYFLTNFVIKQSYSLIVPECVKYWAYIDFMNNMALILKFMKQINRMKSTDFFFFVLIVIEKFVQNLWTFPLFTNKKPVSFTCRNPKHVPILTLNISIKQLKWLKCQYLHCVIKRKEKTWQYNWTKNELKFKMINWKAVKNYSWTFVIIYYYFPPLTYFNRVFQKQSFSIFRVSLYFQPFTRSSMRMYFSLIKAC